MPDENDLGQAPTEGEDSPAWMQALSDEGEGAAQTGGAAEGEGAAEGAAEGGQQQAAAAPAQPSVSFSPEQLEQIMSTAFQKAAPQQQQQLSEDEVNKLLNVVRFAKEHIEALGLEATPERIVQWNKMAQDVSRQAVTISTYYQKLQMQELQQQLAPLREFVEAARTEQMKVKFFEKFPDLKGLDALLLRIKDAYIKEGRQFKSEDEAFQAVAQDARAIVETARKQGNGQPAGAGGQQQRTTTPNKMPRLSGGGQGGAGDTGSAGANLPNWRKAKVLG